MLIRSITKKGASNSSQEDEEIAVVSGKIGMSGHCRLSLLQMAGHLDTPKTEAYMPKRNGLRSRATAQQPRHHWGDTLR